MEKKLTKEEEEGIIKKISKALKVPEEKISKWWERLSESEKGLVAKLSILGGSMLPTYHLLQKSVSLSTAGGVAIPLEETMLPLSLLAIMGFGALGTILSEFYKEQEEERGRSKKKLSGVV